MSLPCRHFAIDIVTAGADASIGMRQLVDM